MDEKTVKRLKTAGMWALNIGLLVLLVVFGGKWGIAGFVSILVLYALVRLFQSRAIFMNVLRMIETSVWNKPLDKDMWDSGEMKRKKVKLVWRRKDEETEEMEEDEKEE